MSMDLLAISPAAYLTVFVVGTLFGSFANVCIYRWPPTEEHPKGRSVVLPGSHCQNCEKAIPFYDNLPIISYLWLRGRCRFCKIEFSPRYLLVEALTGLLFVAVYHLALVLEPGTAFEQRLIHAAIYMAFAFVLVVVTFIDLDHKLILDRVTYPAVPIFYALGLLLPHRAWWEGLVGAAVGYGVVRAISDGYYYLRGREGLGYGDGKLLAVIGALLGWQGVIVALFAGSLVGTVVSVPLALLQMVRAGRDGEEEASAAGAGESAAPAAEAPGSGEEAAAAGEESENSAGEARDVEVDEADEEPPDSLGLVEIPFGPFLALGGVIHLFLGRWIELTMIGGL